MMEASGSILGALRTGKVIDVDSPNKFDWEKPGTTEEQIQKNRYASLQVRHEQIMRAVRRWNEKAKASGYEGIDAALDSLGAMKRGPRPVESPVSERGDK